MKQSIILKTLIILGSVIIAIFISSGYLFLKNDDLLLQKIRKYNLDTAMESLDKREEALLDLRYEQMNDTTDSIAKSASFFLINYDTEGLKKSLGYYLHKENIVAISTWDSTVEEMFLIGIKKEGVINFSNNLQNNKNSEVIKKFLKKDSVYKVFEKNIYQNDNSKELLGKIRLYYDSSSVTNEIAQLKFEIKKKIDAFNTEIDKQRSQSNTIKLYIAAGALITILALISTLLVKFVNNPLKILQEGLDGFFLFLQNKIDSTKKIYIDSNDEFGSMARSLNENISVSARLHEEIHELNNNLEQKVEQRTIALNERSGKIAVLLNNADQGFLSFGEDLIIDTEYSKECDNIFKQDIAGKNIAELLYKDNTKKEFFIQTLMSLLKEDNQRKIKTIISLLQSEFIINKKAISVKYKIIDNKKYMLIFTDITANKILQKKIDREKNILKMIVAVVTDSEEFFELYDEFNEFIKIKDSLVDIQKTPLHNTTELYRTIHTFKGLFAQKEMNQVVSNLHNIECEISQMLSDPNSNNERLQTLFKNSELDQALKKDTDVIKDILGSDFFDKKGKVTVKEETLSQIEQKIIHIANKHNDFSEYEPVVNDIKSLKNRTLLSMFGTYSKLTDQLSQRLGKSIYPLNIVVDKELKAGSEIRPFIKSLVHLFRNCIDHGIETMDERCEIGKDEIGTVSCTINKIKENLHIVIADDGAGIDIDKLKKSASKLGIETSDMSEEDIYKLIFNDNLSTKDTVTDVSGRGVGMAAIKDECDKLNGIIRIKSQKNVGTTFEFIIPA